MEWGGSRLVLFALSPARLSTRTLARAFLPRPTDSGGGVSGR